MKKSTLRGILALFLVAIFVAGICCLGFASRNEGGKWFGNFKNISTWHWSNKGVTGEEGKEPAEIENSENSVQLSDGESNGAKFKVRALRASEYDDYGIDTQSVDGAYEATVTLANHAEATDKSITLSASFAASAAASLNASDYISFSSTTVQSGESFTIICTQAFNYQITITATANGVKEGANPQCSIKADYIHRLKQIDLYLGVATEPGDCYFFEGYTGFKLSTLESGGTKETITTNTNEFIYQETYIPRDMDALFIDIDFLDEYISAGTKYEGYTDFKIGYIRSGYDYDESALFTLQNNATDRDFDEFNFGVCLYYNDSEYGIINFWERNVLGDLHDDVDRASYSEVVNKYNSQTPWGTLYITFTGETTGSKYVFCTQLVVDPVYIYVPAQSPAFNTGDIVF